MKKLLLLTICLLTVSSCQRSKPKQDTVNNPAPQPLPTASAPVVPSDDKPQPEIRRTTAAVASKRSLKAASLVASASESAITSTCTPPGGSIDRKIEKVGTVMSWHDCMMFVQFDDGTSDSLFAGFGEQNTAPAIGVRATIAYDSSTRQVLYARFENTPFAQASPSP